jgi:multiple antibiotic resistance protein
MSEIAFVFTVFFMLLGPVKLIPSFAGLTRDATGPFKRSVAIWSVVIAAVLCAFVVLAGGTILGKYRISIDAVRIAGGLVLLIAALRALFPRGTPTGPGAGTRTAVQLAAAPMAVPNIVPPAGVAAILLFMLMAPERPGMTQAVVICLGVVMVLDLLVMYFVDAIMKTPGLTLVLTVLGAVLLFVQVCLAMQMMLVAIDHLGSM